MDALLGLMLVRPHPVRCRAGQLADASAVGSRGASSTRHDGAQGRTLLRLVHSGSARDQTLTDALEAAGGSGRRAPMAKRFALVNPMPRGARSSLLPATGRTAELSARPLRPCCRFVQEQQSRQLTVRLGLTRDSDSRA